MTKAPLARGFRFGQRFAYLRDPDGNTVALFAPLG
jgi:hypothetical protein